MFYIEGRGLLLIVMEDARSYIAKLPIIIISVIILISVKPLVCLHFMVYTKVKAKFYLF